jgi:hypothetical protein
VSSAHATLHVEAVRAWLAQHGWEAEQASLYDEEGVEGWSWVHVPTGATSTTTGDWRAPPEIPDDLMALAEAGLAEKPLCTTHPSCPRLHAPS